jgi:ribosomal protein L39E
MSSQKKKNQANDEIPIYVILKSSIWTNQNTML